MSESPAPQSIERAWPLPARCCVDPEFAALERDAAFGASWQLGADDEAPYWRLWPSTMLSALPGRLQTNRVIPLDAQRCRVEFDDYYRQGTDPRTASKDREFADQVQAEDGAICEAVQRPRRAAPKPAGRSTRRGKRGSFASTSCCAPRIARGSARSCSTRKPHRTRPPQAASATSSSAACAARARSPAAAPAVLVSSR